jgi:hypothetical protein
MHLRHGGLEVVDTFGILAQNHKDLTELLFRRRHGHLPTGEVGMVCQDFNSAAAADHADLGTDLRILAINATRANHKESQPSGITAPDRSNEVERKSVNQNLVGKNFWGRNWWSKIGGSIRL